MTAANNSKLFVVSLSDLHKKLNVLRADYMGKQCESELMYKSMLNVEKSATYWKSVLNVEKLWQNVLNVEKISESVFNVEKVLESLLNIEKVC